MGVRQSHLGEGWSMSSSLLAKWSLLLTKKPRKTRNSYFGQKSNFGGNFFFFFTEQQKSGSYSWIFFLKKNNVNISSLNHQTPVGSEDLSFEKGSISSADKSDHLKWSSSARCPGWNLHPPSLLTEQPGRRILHVRILSSSGERKTKNLIFLANPWALSEKSISLLLPM